MPKQIHLDLRGAGPTALATEHARALDLGATLRLDRSDDPDEPLRVYADPAGHLFCLIGAANTDDTEWQRLLAAPRHINAALSRATIPDGPGVYAWFEDDQCVYVGRASNLRSRLSTHRSRSLDLSRSTLRASVAVRILGVTRAHARSRPTRMTPAQIEPVTAWFQRAEVAWLTCATTDAATALEKKLRISSMPPLNRV